VGSCDRSQRFEIVYSFCQATQMGRRFIDDRTSPCNSRPWSRHARCRVTSRSWLLMDHVRKLRVLRKRPKVWAHGQAYPVQRYMWPRFVLSGGCQSPLSEDCNHLDISPQWAIACFKPTYHRLRKRYGDDYQAIVDAFLETEMPQCQGRPKRGAEHELQRRIALAVAILMNREGSPVRYPPPARFPRPSKAQVISQPWLRALITGWF
jgi:hypothetical protein